MRKLILKWLLKDKNFSNFFESTKKEINSYIKLLEENIKIRQKYIDAIDEHLRTLKKSREFLRLTDEMIEICKKHKIDLDEELEV